MMIDTADAVKVASEFYEDYITNKWSFTEEDRDVLFTELEQKSYLTGCEEPARRLMDLIMDVNPTEICAQIQSDNLTEWCKSIQTEMQMALIRMQKGWTS